LGKRKRGRRALLALREREREGKIFGKLYLHKQTEAKKEIPGKEELLSFI
jgi:hypothetical protein